jgi:exodeoxyribonuclease VII large subunit
MITDTPLHAQKVYQVSELTREIKGLLEESFPVLWVEGEISGYKRHSSGHHYFTLKDSLSQLSAVMWRGRAAALNFTPVDGMKVLAWGSLSVYEAGGRYQLDVLLLRPAGLGELQIAFEALKARLAAEGLFDTARKRPLPPFPKRIGLVTSPDGAALQDMRTVAAKRWPAAVLVLAGARVQGEGAASEISAAIKDLNAFGKVDLIVIGRGGGSLEDLWAFNEEIVARAIFASKTPVVSAVGHEVDFTISDFVADVRAPTPSAAMEIILPDREEIAAQLAALRQRLARRVIETLTSAKGRLSRLATHWALRRPVDLVRGHRQRLDELEMRLQSASNRLTQAARQKLAHIQDLLRAHHPDVVLARGFSIVTRPDGSILRDASATHIDETLHVRLRRGALDASVETIQPSVDSE